MAIGASIQDGLGGEVERVSALIGEGTSNIAEYRAAIEGLKRAKDLGAKKVELRMDSELVVRQIEGLYKINSEHLKPLYSEVMTLLQSFTKYTVKHVRRDDNARADELANLAYEPVA
jgi:ribonuclease HI